MANVKYVTANKLTLELEQEKRSFRRLVLVLGIPSIIFSYLIFPQSIMVSVVIVFLIYHSYKGDSIIKSGAEGENIALHILMNLPENYFIFNQVAIPNKTSRVGFNEADLIVLSERTLFVIEVKHNNGCISGGEKEQEWKVPKVGRGGTGYTSSMRNPISQVKKLVWLLSEFLKKKNANIWIQGLVLFSNQNASIAVEGETSIPIFQDSAICRYITDFKGSSSSKKIDRIKRELGILKLNSG